MRRNLRRIACAIAFAAGCLLWIQSPALAQKKTKQNKAWSQERAGAWYKYFWPLGEKVGVKTLKDTYVPFRTEKTKDRKKRLPARPNLAVELGNGFLDTGKLHQGFEIPVIGAVWQPRLWAYAINRLTVQSFKDGRSGRQRETEIANRLDLFFNLQLTGTEKILLGLRSLDNNRPDRFTRYTFSGAQEGFNEEFNLGLETLFFEGDFGSLFPFPCFREFILAKYTAQAYGARKNQAFT